MKELWSKILSHPDYEISTEGRIRRIKRINGNYVFDSDGRPVYRYLKKANTVVLAGKRKQIKRLMAEVFMNNGEPLPKNKWVSGETKIGRLQINPAAAHVRKSSIKDLIYDFCMVNGVNDLKCQKFLLEQTGKTFSIKTIKTYRLGLGFRVIF